VKKNLLLPVIIGLTAALAVGGFAYAQTSLGSNSLSASGSSTSVSTATHSHTCPGWRTPKVKMGHVLPAGSTLRPERACGYGFGKLRGLLSGLISRVAHVSAIVNLGNGWQTYDADQGNVTSTNASQIVINRLDGVTITDNVSSTTQYLFGSQNNVQVGDRVIIVSQNSNALYVLDLTRHIPTSTSTTMPESSSIPTSSFPCVCHNKLCPMIVCRITTTTASGSSIPGCPTCCGNGLMCPAQS
jgi:hypothetical protein